MYAFFIGLGLLALPACGGRLYKVAPLPNSTPPEVSSESTTGLSAGAVVLDGDSALERFDANLPLAGVIAVDLLLVNKSAGSVDGSRLKFELRDAAGRILKPLTSKKALDRVMKYYGNSFFALAARQKTRDDYEEVALKHLGPIGSQEERRGILFFQTERETSNLSGLTLSIKGTAVPIDLQLTAR